MNSFLKTLEAKGVTVDVENLESLITCIGWKDIGNMTKEEVNEFRDYVNIKLSTCEFDSDEWDMWYGVYLMIDEAELFEYAKKKNEPDFDWDFYSDWYKDVYGFRPRW